MMNKDGLKKVAQQIMKRKPVLQDKQIMHPARDWYVGLLVALVIIGGAAAWSSLTYLENRNKVVDVSTEENDNTVVYRESAVAEALAIFEKRNAVREAFLSNRNAASLEPVASSTEEVNVDSSASSTTEEVGLPELVTASTSVSQ